MSNIPFILPYSNFEQIRSKIASILADELGNQLALNRTSLDIEENRPSPNQDLIDFYELNISCIPDRVYEERFFRPQPAEMPLINVVLLNVPLNEGTSHASQIGENKYQIEIYQSAKSTENEGGDTLATIKLHRLLAIVRSILMDRNYIDLGLTSIVGRRQVQDISIGLPNIGADNANSMIFGKMDLLVKSTEAITDLEGVPLQISNTNMKIYDSDKGYYWEIDNS